MLAVVYGGPGELRLEERATPVPAVGEVLVAPARVGICGSDLLIWDGGLTRVTPPVVLGHEFSGVVVDANGCAGVSEGDRVVVEPLLACGECAPCRAGDYNVCDRLGLLGIDRDGGAAELVAVPAGRLHAIPDGLSLEHAALAEPSAVAVHMTARAGVQDGDRVLVVGGGPIGALVACVCRARGVSLLVIAEPNPGRRALLLGLGFDVVDPLEVAPLAYVGGEPFDVAFELTAVAAGLASAVGSVRVHGTVLLGGLPPGTLPLLVPDAVLKELTLLGARVYRGPDIDEAIALIAEGVIPAAALTTRTVPLTEAVAGAFEHLRTSRDDMKILIDPTGKTA